MNFLSSKSECNSQQDCLNPYKPYNVVEQEQEKEPLVDWSMFFLVFVPLYGPVFFIIIAWIIRIITSAIG